MQLDINNIIPSTESLTVPKNTTMKLYYYVYNENLLENINKTGIILPSNKTKSDKTLALYAKRTESGNPEDYYKDLYHKFYEKTVKKPYDNYGIWMTPVDIFTFAQFPVYRYHIDINLINGHTAVLQINNRVALLNTIDNISDLMKDFSTEAKCKKAWDDADPKYKFEKLPQVIDFSGPLDLMKSVNVKKAATGVQFLEKNPRWKPKS